MTTFTFNSKKTNLLSIKTKVAFKNHFLFLVLLLLSFATISAKTLPTSTDVYSTAIESLLPPCCNAPDDITVSCAELHPDFPENIIMAYETDPEGTLELLNTLFGFPSTDGCTSDTIVELEVQLNINNCGWGIITRRFEAWEWGTEGDVNGNGVLDREEAIISENDCSQQITITETHAYQINFPADIDVTSIEGLDFDIQTQTEGCDILAFQTSEPVLITSTGDECYKYAVTYDIINWCIWDGEYTGYIVPRKGISPILNPNSVVDSTQAPVLWANDDGVIIDYTHPIMGETPDNALDSITCLDNSNLCRGRWNYTQIINVHEPNTPCEAISPCPVMYVFIATGEIRPCRPEQYEVQYCNLGGETAENASIEVTIDPALTVLGSSTPWDSQNENTYTFELGNLPAGECGNIQINFSLPCNTPAGATYCAEVYAYPDSTCTPINPEWDGSEIELSIDCLGDSLMFNIKNIGDGNMAAPQEYTITEDNVLLYDIPPTFQLDAGQIMSIVHPTDGFLYYIKSQQADGFPGLDMPTSWIEGCGSSINSNQSTINQYPLGDEDTWHDIFCLEAVNSYDPNDKNGFPRGLGDQNYIDQNQALEYIIRFQNTGTAEALHVEIKDNITDLLDLGTLRLGASSHPYTWRIENDNTLVLIFENINLAYEDMDEEGSKGFIQFKIEQQPDLPIGSQIKNTAAIYFDNNPPIITNETLHTIGEDYLATWIKEIPAKQLHEILVFPNPVSNQVYIEIKDVAIQQTLQLELYDVLGNQLMRTSFDNKTTPIVMEQYPVGTYLFKAYKNKQLLGVGKIVKM